MAETTTVRVSSEVQKILKQLSKATRRSQTALLEEAVEDFRRKKIFDEANRIFAALKADSKQWNEELEERTTWELTLRDGQD